MSQLKSGAERFRVIQGGGQVRSPWLSPPSSVLGRSPFDRERIMAFRTTTLDVEKAISAGNRREILDLWWFVHGEIPPVAGAERYKGVYDLDTGHGLRSAYASYRGLMRPAGEDDHGFDFAAFVTKPKIAFRYEPSMSCLIQPYKVPDDLVVVIYARLDFPEGRAYQARNGKKPATNGVLTHWQYVECDPKNTLLPIDHETRFRRRLW